MAKLFASPAPPWHGQTNQRLAEQGAERRPVVPLGGLPAPARRARARALAQGGHLRRHDLGLQRRRQPLRLGEPQPELGHADALVAPDAGELRLGAHAGSQLSYQFHPPHQLRHRLIPAP